MVAEYGDGKWIWGGWVIWVWLINMGNGEVHEYEEVN